MTYTIHAKRIPYFYQPMMKYLSYLSVRFLSLIFRELPFRILYRFSNLVGWLLLNVIKYRVKTATDNLNRAFPFATKAQKRAMLKDTYRNLADVFLETIKGNSMSRDEITKRYHLKNPQLVKSYFHEDQSIILVLAHTSNWEWAGLALGMMAPEKILCIYKPMRNKLINQYSKDARSRFGMGLFPPEETRTIIKKMRQEPSAIVLVADQSPPSAASAIWVDFFGQETGFVPGPEFFARRYNFPVINMDIKRIERGYYQVEFVLISDQGRNSKKGDITAEYANQLEILIRRDVGSWLWTHKRWKKVKPVFLKDRKSVIN